MSERERMPGIETMLEGLAARSDEMEGFSVEQLRTALEEPGAAESVQRLAEREAASVQQGEPARDFTLPFLDPERSHETLTLSRHFGRRPVALVFGSYT